MGEIATMKKKYIKGKYLFILLFFVFSCSTIFSQNSKNRQQVVADSLFNTSNTYIKKGDFKKALLNAERSLQLFKSLENTKSIGNGLNKIGTIYYYQSDFTKALAFYTKSIPYFKKVNYKKGIAATYNNQGAIYYYLGNYPKSLDYYKKALKLHEELDNTKQLAGTIKNIGGIYYELKDYENAMKHFVIAKKTFKTLSDEKKISQVLNGIGEIYTKQNEYEKALVNFKEALRFAKKNNDQQKTMDALFGLGKLHFILEDYKKALKYYNQASAIATKINSPLFVSKTLVGLGTLKLKLGAFKAAIKKCKEGLKMATKLSVISLQKEACNCLYTSYKKANKHTVALKYFEQMHLLKDSLNLKQTTNKLLNMKFEKEMLLDSIVHVEKERKATVAHQKVVEKKEKQRNVFIIAGCFALLLAIAIFSRLNFVKKSKARLQIEKDRSEHLLHNILPEEVAQELKEKGYVDAQDFEKAAILFTDFKSFTETASQLTPKELVAEINVCFKAFDTIIETYKIEKIKTIGDAYMAAGGLPKPDANAVKNTILAGLEMQDFTLKRKLENDILKKPAFEMRVGIHVGPIVAGIVGVKKFQYDIWGDAVNTASRMESNSKVGKVNISQDTYQLVKDEKEFAFEYRGKINAKGKGDLAMYFVALKT